MKRFVLLACALIFAGAALAQSSLPVTFQTVEVPSGSLRLKAYLWKPAGAGPFPAVLFNHGRSDHPQQRRDKLTITAGAQVLGPVFAKHGYVFLYLFRRGEGLSANQGKFIGDLLRREEAAKGKEARNHLQFVLLTTDHLDDALAGLSFLKSLASVDTRRIAVAGHSFGGQLALLAAERDSSVRAVAAFAPAAASWDGSPELRQRLLEAVRKITVPVMFLQAANDYSVAPTRVMSEEMSRLGRRNVRKLYPAVGASAAQGHSFVYSEVGLWEDDVFRFLDGEMKQ
jgi:dienelactone hydrolase